MVVSMCVCVWKRFFFFFFWGGGGAVKPAARQEIG